MAHPRLCEAPLHALRRQPQMSNDTGLLVLRPQSKRQKDGEAFVVHVGVRFLNPERSRPADPSLAWRVAAPLRRCR